MIAAKKNAAFNALARRWVARTLRRRFHGIYLAGGEHFDALEGRAVVGCVNHTNWWDGFVLYVLSYLRLPHDIFLAMEAGNLRRYRFFTWMGVFGVELAAGARNLAALRYAVNLLRRPSVIKPSLIWMFVQGALRNERQPVEARPGAAFLARQSGALLLPLVLRYAWLNESRPSIFIRAGVPMAHNTSSDDLAAALNALLAETDQTLDPPDLGSYVPLFEPKMSINKRWDYLRHRLGGRREVFDKSNR